MGKQPVVIKKDTAGFVVNCILILALNEAASSRRRRNGNQEIDKATKLALNWPMDPLALLDYVGADTVLAIRESIEERAWHKKIL